MNKEDQEIQKRLEREDVQRVRARLNSPESAWFMKWSVKWVIILIAIIFLGTWWLWGIGFFTPS